MKEAITSYDEIVDRMVVWAVDEPRVRSLWAEGETLHEVRRPYPRLRLHAAADEPAFPALVSDLGRSLGSILEAQVLQVADVQRFAKELLVKVGSLEFRLVVEQTSLLAKRPRSEVVPLVDKTGHLCHVMDFSLRKRL